MRKYKKIHFNVLVIKLPSKSDTSKKKNLSFEHSIQNINLTVAKTYSEDLF